MSRQYLREEDQALLKRAARLIVDDHSESGREILEALFVRLAACPPRSGVTARKHWIAVMQALGESCLTIAKLEKAREPGI